MICKDCGNEKPKYVSCKGHYQCEECFHRSYSKADLIANPNFTLDDYREALPLHPVDKYGWKRN